MYVKLNNFYLGYCWNQIYYFLLLKIVFQ